jgi:hypothetical protein
MKSAPQKRIHDNRLQGSIVVLVVVVFPLFLAMGCKMVQCAPALSCEMQPVDKVVYPKIWTSGKYDSFRLVVTTGPYRVKDKAITRLKNVVKEQAGLDIEVIEGIDTGLPADRIISQDEAVIAAIRQIPPGDTPVVVVVAVNGAHGKGFIIDFQAYLREVAKNNNIELPNNLSKEVKFIGVIVLNRSSFIEHWFEDIVLIHEVGHWLGIPVREFHTGCDKSHCTNGRCLMFAGKWDFPMTMRLLGANLLTGPPRQFCLYCAEELTEMRRQRETNNEKLNAK